jgi:hypothetical protein
MRMLKAHVSGGRIVVDEPTSMPDGSEVQLALIDGDELDDEERLLLHAALAESEDDVVAGRVRPAADVLADLMRQR